MLTYRHGFNFAIPIVVAGISVSIFGLFMILDNPIGALALMLIGAFLWTNTSGMQFDLIQGRFREYGSFFGIKSGEWISLGTTPYLAVLIGKKGYTMLSQSNRSASTAIDVFQVFLLSETHRTKYMVRSFEMKEEARSFAEELAGRLNKKVVTYDPQVSAETRARRGY